VLQSTVGLMSGSPAAASSATQSPWSLLPSIPASASTLSCQGKHPGAGLARTSLAAFPPIIVRLSSYTYTIHLTPSYPQYRNRSYEPPAAPGLDINVSTQRFDSS
jgi:hypothetical protein